MSPIRRTASSDCCCTANKLRDKNERSFPCTLIWGMNADARKVLSFSHEIETKEDGFPSSFLIPHNPLPYSKPE